MRTSLSNLRSNLRIAATSVFVLTILLGTLHPLILWVVSELVFRDQANGSLVVRGGRVVGSRLIGQPFGSDRYFHPRPSAAGAGYDATASGGTNLGPASDKLLHGVHGSKKPDGTRDSASDFNGVQDLADAYRRDNGLAPAEAIPVDAVTRSGSGLDPDISVENARLQASRVARARGVPAETMRAWVDAHVQRRDLGILGDPRANVLLLNLALDDTGPATSSR